MNNSSAATAKIVRALRPKVSINELLYAAERLDAGNGSSTVAFELGIHYRTASLAMDAGRLLPRVA